MDKVDEMLPNLFLKLFVNTENTTPEKNMLH